MRRLRLIAVAVALSSLIGCSPQSTDAPKSRVELSVPIPQAARLPSPDSVVVLTASESASATPSGLSAPQARCEDIKIRAHRCNSGGGAENTRRALEEALRAGFEYVELDVRQLVDGTWALHHDALIGRVVQGSGENRLSALNAAQWRALTVRHPDGTQEAPSVLEDVLPILSAHPKVHALLEIKGTPACPAVHALVQRVEAVLSQRVQISALSLPVLTCVRQVSTAPVALVIAPQVTDAELERAQPARQMFAKDLERYGVKPDQSRETLRRAYAQNGNWDLLKSPQQLQAALRPLAPVSVLVDAAMLSAYQAPLEHVHKNGVRIVTYSAQSPTTHAQYVHEYQKATGTWTAEWIIEGAPQSVCARIP